MTLSTWARRTGEAFRAARLAAGFTQERLAETIGVHVTTVQRVEAGQAIQPATATSWERACKVTIKLVMEEGAHVDELV